MIVERQASGHLLLVKNGPIGARLPLCSNMTAFLSTDDGKTWPHALLLDDRALVSYPDGFQSPDGVIHIIYDSNRHTDAEILLAKFREEDCIAGKFARPGAKPRMLVNKAYSPAAVDTIRPDPKWTVQAAKDALQDFTSHRFRRRQPQPHGVRHDAARSSRRDLGTADARRRQF